MEIKAKFNIGDTIYFMYDNKVCNSPVCSISVWIGSQSKEIFRRLEQGQDINNRG